MKLRPLRKGPGQLMLLSLSAERGHQWETSEEGALPAGGYNKAGSGNMRTTANWIQQLLLAGIDAALALLIGKAYQGASRQINVVSILCAPTSQGRILNVGLNLRDNFLITIIVKPFG